MEKITVPSDLLGNADHPLLVVDDEENILSVLTDILEMDGYPVTGVVSGQAARDAARRGQFHAALLDYSLGDTTGLALAKDLRALDPEISVILMTAHASLDMAVEAIQLDVYDYLIKPVDVHHLKRTLKKALEKRRLSVENKQLLSELTKANLALNRSNELKSRFLSVVSHDLRTPLSSIKGYAHVLDEGPAIPPEKRADFLQIIIREADHLNSLIDDLTDFVSMEAGKLRIEKSLNSLGDILAEVTARMEPHALEKRIALTLSVPTDLPSLMVDKGRLGQVLTNLVGNAFKHTSEGGAVTVIVKRVSVGVLISVEDTGSGIFLQDLPHLFERFYQGKTSKGGIGLGLAICQEIVKAHGGEEIHAHSDGPGTGSRFWFTLPLEIGPN
jgi:signal transduction histidine kinase